MLKQLIKLHKILFMIAVLFTFLSVILNLCRNKFLARLMDFLETTDFVYFENKIGMFYAVRIFIVFI